MAASTATIRFPAWCAATPTSAAIATTWSTSGRSSWSPRRRASISRPARAWPCASAPSVAGDWFNERRRILFGNGVRLLFRNGSRKEKVICPHFRSRVRAGFSIAKEEKNENALEDDAHDARRRARRGPSRGGAEFRRRRRREGRQGRVVHLGGREGGREHRAGVPQE